MADPERLLDLNREAREQIAEGVLQREPEHHGPDGRRRRKQIAEEERGGESEQRDDHRVLDDVRELLRNAIDPPGVDCQRDDRVDQAEGEQHRQQAADLPARIIRDGGRCHDGRADDIRRQQRARDRQLAPDVAVDGDGAQRQRRQENDDSDSELSHSRGAFIIAASGAHPAARSRRRETSNRATCACRLTVLEPIM